MKRQQIMEPSKTQRFKKQRRNCEEENERLREFSLELFKEGYKLGFKKGYNEAIEKTGKIEG